MRDDDWWKKYIEQKDEDEDEDDSWEAAKKVADEEFEFTMRNLHWYLLALVLGLLATFMFVGAFLSIMHVIYN